jgi:hypothetical protein|nr:MAG TPA: hypothetical protein [Caudoviricetes sp.]
MTRKELEDMKGLKSLLEDAKDTSVDIYDKLKELKETPLNYLLQEIDMLQVLNSKLYDNLEDLTDAIEELEKALNKIDIVE